MHVPKWSRDHPFLPLENPLARSASVSRYTFAKEHIRGGRVLEAGCGARAGAVGLVERAVSVLAVDVSSEGVSLAARSYPHQAVRYAVMDAQRLALAEETFDVVVSLEVIEHLVAPREYLSEIARVLRPGGIYIGSTPNRGRPGWRPNPDHVQEFTSAEYRSLLSEHFEPVALYVQRPLPAVLGRGEGLRRGMTKMDRLGVRRWVPQAWKDVINRRFFRLKSAHLVGWEDWEIRAEGDLTPEEVTEAVVLCTVAHRRAQKAMRH